MKMRAFLALLAMFCILLPALAQTQPAAPPQPQKPGDDDDVVKITTNLVQVDAVVTKDGKPVKNLTADDFEIYEDGRKQAITSFAFISNVTDTTTSQPVTKSREKAGDIVPFSTLKPDAPPYPGSDVYFAFVLYNAGEESGQLRNLVVQAKLFRDGKNVFTGSETPITAANQTDLARVFASGAVHLPPELDKGDYYLQIAVRDTAKDKTAPLVQWAAFEIEK